MNKEQYSRTEALLGTEALKKLRHSRVIVFGVGGVGGHVVEALARSGVGALDLVDKDVVSISNLNRQIIALQSTVGRSKVEVMKERILDINPDCRVNTFCKSRSAAATRSGSWEYWQTAKALIPSCDQDGYSRHPHGCDPLHPAPTS